MILAAPGQFYPGQAAFFSEVFALTAADVGATVSDIARPTATGRALADPGAGAGDALLARTPHVVRTPSDTGVSVGELLRASGLARSGADSYADGAAATFGVEAVEFPDYAMYVDSFPAYAAPPGLAELYYARLPFPEAQRELGATAPAGPGRAVSCTWHGRRVDAERGSVVLVRAGGPYEAWVGERVRITTRGGARRTVVGFVRAAATLGDADEVSVPRRMFMGLATPGFDRVPVILERLQ